ncbi:MAG: peptidylprolyl isomerase [Pseudomonadota bacterium]
MTKGIKILSAAAWLLATPAWPELMEGKPSPAEVLESSAPSDWRALDPENTLYIELEAGRIVVALSTTLAQNHVAQIKALAREGFYDGLSFYRVINGFVAQGGDPFGVREVKTAQKAMTAEFEEPITDQMPIAMQKDVDGYAQTVGWIDSLPVGVDAATSTVWHLHCTGAFAYGRNNEKDSASTEFYIALQPQRYLDRNLTVAGRVVQGMEHVQALRRVSPPESENDDLGDTIIAMRVAADISEAERTDLEILDSSNAAFANYVEARRNRPEEFFYYRPDHVDVCALNVPVRPVSAE